MQILAVHDVTVQFAGQAVLSGVSFQLAAGGKACLVGENGCGKSTLLRVLAGELKPDAGRVDCARGLRLAYAPQHLPPQAAATTTLEFALELCAEPDAAVREHAGRRMLSALGLGREALQRPLSLLSGGEQARAALARALLAEAELLLLDEPDHHLDLAGRRFMARELSRYPGAVLLASHDRTLLDAVATCVLELEDGELRTEHGTLAEYLARKRARLARQAVEYAQQQQRIERLEADIARTQQAAQRFQTTSANDHWRQVGKKVAKTAVVRKRLLERELSAARRVEQPRERERIGLKLEAQRGSRLLLQLDGVSLTLGGRTLLKDASLRLERGERLAVTGPNGAGKTTLLKVALGLLAPDAGSVWRSGAECFYCDQLHAGLDPVLSALAVLEQAGGVAHNRAHLLLARRGLRDRAAHKPVAALSGGERTRLLLALIEECQAGLLVLDEPTNHLDLPSLEVFEAALQNYGGGVLLVSHDERLVANVATARYELREGRLAAG